MKSNENYSDYLKKASLYIKEDEQVVPEVLQLVVDEMTKIQQAVGNLSKIYRDYPDLNNNQPNNMENVIPMSLDDWELEISNVVDEWKKLI